jgi:hypothetical protein
MQLKINQHFNITSDLLNNDLIRGARYDVGELNRYLIGMKPLLHVSQYDKNLDAIYFNFIYSTPLLKTPSLHQLIYFPAPNTDLLKQCEQAGSKTNQFYYVVTGHVDQDFLKAANEKNIEKFNFSSAFKKASLKDWSILIASAGGLKPNCTLLNTFLSLGARISLMNENKIKFKNGLERKEVIALSFQHSIEIFEKKL